MYGNPTQYILPLALAILGAMVIAYLLGSISFSIIITKIAKNQDVRDVGSGNAGATNVLRAAGKKAAALTFLFDFLKCVAAVVLGRFIVALVCTHFNLPPEVSNLGAYAAGFACMMGHIFPLYFGFRGGKGVVTLAAMIALIDWRVFVLLFAIFLIVFLAKKIVSLSSVVGAALYPVGTFLVTYLFDYKGSPLSVHGEMDFWYLITVTLLSAMIGGVVVLKHKANIKRLLQGTEKPISFKSNK